VTDPAPYPDQGSDLRLGIVEHQLVRPDGTVLVSVIGNAYLPFMWSPYPGDEPTGPRAHRIRQFPEGQWYVVEFFDWNPELEPPFQENPSILP
jgi:hypothetical protein